jgi:hypothetical protein
LDCFSLNDSGTETLALDESDGTWSVAGETDQFEIHDSVTNQYGVSGSESANYAGTFTEVDTGTYGGSNWYSIDDNGEDSLVGTATESSDSYTLSDGDHFSETEGGHYSGTIRSSNWYYGILESIGSDSGNTATEEDYTLVAHGTDSFGPDGDDESTMSFDADGTYTSSTEASWSFLTLNAGNDASLTDVHGAFNEYDSATDATSGWSTVSDGTTVLSYHEYLSTFFSETVSDTYGPTVGGTDTFGELTIQSTCGSTTDITGNNWSGFTTITHSSNYSSESSLTGGWEWSDTDEFEIVGGIPESATSGSLLVEFQDEQDGAGKLLADYSSGSIFLYDSYGGYWLDAGYCYVPHSVPAYLSGLAPDVGLAPSGWPVTAPSSNAAFGFVPSTNAATAHGLPTEKASALDNLALNDGPTDGVSQTATAPPTSVLVTLAAAGRNPTDILIPTQAGTEGASGGEGGDAVVASSGTKEAATKPSSAAAPVGSTNTASTASSGGGIASASTTPSNTNAPASSTGGASAGSSGVAATVAVSSSGTTAASSTGGVTQADVPGGDGGGAPAGSHVTPKPGGYVGGWFNPLNWRRGLYTGNANAPDEYYEAAIEGAGGTKAAANAGAFINGLAEGAVVTAVVTVVVGTCLVALAAFASPVVVAGAGIVVGLAAAASLSYAFYQACTQNLTEEQRYKMAGQLLGGAGTAVIGAQITSAAMARVAPVTPAPQGGPTPPPPEPLAAPAEPLAAPAEPLAAPAEPVKAAAGTGQMPATEVPAIAEGTEVLPEVQVRGAWGADQVHDVEVRTALYDAETNSVYVGGLEGHRGIARGAGIGDKAGTNISGLEIVKGPDGISFNVRSGWYPRPLSPAEQVNIATALEAEFGAPAKFDPNLGNVVRPGAPN